MLHGIAKESKRDGIAKIKQVDQNAGITSCLPMF
jgi:hypothetical protein